MTRPLPAWMRPAPDSELAESLRRGRSARAVFVHLLWSSWLLVTPLFDRGYTWQWVGLTLASYPLFLALYLGCVLGPRRRVPAYALAMMALCLVLLRWYPSGLSYFIFGAVFLPSGRQLPLWRVLLELVLANAVLLMCARWLGYPWFALAWMPVTSLVVSIVIRYETQAGQHEAALRLSHEQVRQLAATAERERIGRDLHDLLGHSLSLVALKSDLATRLLASDPQAARAEMEQVGQVARQALAQVRRAVSGIRAAQLAAELASARLLLETAGVAVEYQVDDLPLPGPAETALALAVREAATNIQRHAQASRARIQVFAEAGQLVLQVDDDGRGGHCVPGTGLTGMGERLRALGGSLQVDSTRGGGTVLRARLPLATASGPAA